MKKYIYLFALAALIPFLSYSQIHIAGSGEIVSSGVNHIVLTGDWTNNSSGTGYTSSTDGYVDFKGSAKQSITGSTSTSFSNVLSKNQSGIVLNTNTSITGNLDLRKGIFDATSSTLTFSNGGKSRYPSNTSHIKGPVSRIGTTYFRFDVGNGTKYEPLRILNLNTTAKSAMITVEYFKSAAPNGINVTAPLVKVSEVEYWNVKSSVSGSKSKIDLYWEDGAESGIKSVHPDSLKLARWDGSSWIDEVATISGTVSSGDIETNSRISIDDVNVTFGSTNNVANPLPIQLLSFTAQCQKQDVLINWTTASEENNDYFTLLRSEDAEHYEEIAQITGAGNSNEVLNYSYTDWNAANGNFYYLLKQTDYNGKSETFTPVHVNCDNTKEVALKVLYDGSQAYAVLNNAESGSRYNMMIIDYTGRVVVEQQQTVNSQNYYRIPSDKLAAGLYSIIYFTDDGATRLNQKFFVR